MLRRIKFAILLIVLSLSFPLQAKPKQKIRKKVPLKKVVSKSEVKKIKETKEPKEQKEQERSGPYRFFVNNSFGFSHLGGLGFFSGVGVGFVFSEQSQLSLGVDGNLALYSQGSVFSPLAAVWYHFSGNAHLEPGATLGLLGGPAFSGGVPSVRPTSWVLCTEASWNKKLSDLVLLRVLLRPGIIDSRFFFQGGIGFVFRFA